MGPTEHHSEEAILNAAQIVFLRRGFYGTRMQEIADEAGINKALLHYYFRSKDKIFEAIPKKFLKQIKDEIDAGRIEKQDPRHILVSLLSLAIFPFAAKPILQFGLNLTDEEFKQFIIERKKYLS